jgi:predicted naringenin-chalcone synthase
MPGLSYRLAKKLPHLINETSILLDLGNVGCTGGIKALNCANHLDESFKNILVISVEIPSTLINIKSEKIDIWQGNCTFGDGAAALWISNTANFGEQPLKIEKIHTVQKSIEGLDLIKWGYDNYYTFNVDNEKTFNKDVRIFLTQTLQATESSWKDNPHWAIHPAGIALLMRLSRKLGLPREAMKATTGHYEKHSNMSSAGILHIIRSIQHQIEVDEAINLITMGAGFSVIYGCLRKVTP